MSARRVRPLFDHEMAQTERKRPYRDTELGRAHLTSAPRVEELVTSNLQRTEYLAILSHEFRNALAPLTNALLILQSAQEADSAVRAQAHALIQRQVVHLTQLVEELQDTSVVGLAGIRLQPGRIDLRDVVQRSVEAVMSAFTHHKHRISLSLPHEPLWLDADAIRIEQVAVNLLSNAAKYTLPGGRIDVLVDRKLDRAEFRVVDSGIGIAPEMLPRVFDLFARAETTRDYRRGMGIGLNVVRRIVSQHGGSVVARSAGLGAGSEFLVSLPLQRSTA